MAVLTVNPIVLAGFTSALVAAAGGGDLVPDDGNERTYVEVLNGSGASINVTVAPVETSRNVGGIGSVTIPSIVVAVAAGARKKIGPFPSAYRNSSGQVALAYSAVTTVTVGAFSLPRTSN